MALASAKTPWFSLEDSGYSFETFKREFSRTYASPAEERSRRAIFERHLAEAIAHNKQGHPWKKGINRFSDNTHEEFRRVLGIRRDVLHREMRQVAKKQNGFSAAASSVPIRHSVDWRTEGVISDVKDQGDCGSCWAHAAVEGVESYWALARGQLATLSVQSVLDWTSNPKQCGGSGGCGGATVSLGLETMMARGAPQEFTYPYMSYFGGNQTGLSMPQSTPFATVVGYNHLPSNQLAPVLQHLSSVGPLSATVDASAWQSYEAGVFTGCVANATIDHGIFLTGYGVDKDTGLDYFLIKNSWSVDWGMQGTIKIARQPAASTPCGWDNNPLEGSGCPGGPTSVKVCGACAILYSTSYPIIASA